MSDLYWLTDEHIAKLAPFLPRSHGKPRVDDRRVLSGIIFINCHGLRWRDAPRDLWAAQDALQPVEALERERHFRQNDDRASRRARQKKTVMIDAPYLKAHRTTTSLAAKKGGVDASSAEPRAA